MSLDTVLGEKITEKNTKKIARMNHYLNSDNMFDIPDSVYVAADRFLLLYNHELKPIYDKIERKEELNAEETNSNGYVQLFLDNLSSYVENIIEEEKKASFNVSSPNDRESRSNWQADLKCVDRFRRDCHYALVVGLSLANRLWKKLSEDKYPLPAAGIYTGDAKDIYEPAHKVGVHFIKAQKIGDPINTDYITKKRTLSKIGEWAGDLYIGLYLENEHEKAEKGLTNIESSF